MNTLAEKNEQLKMFLDEAVDLLDDIKDKLGMFQTQRYYRLKKDLENKPYSIQSCDNMPQQHITIANPAL